MGNLTAEYRHVPVMLSQVLAELDPKVGEVVCDCTLGGAGHSVELARRIAPEGLLVGIDQDDMALEAATARLASEVPEAEVLVLKGNFSQMDDLLTTAEIPGVDCFLFDLGVSSPQLDIPERGFSYNEDAPLDMRMDPDNNTLTAAEVINHYNEADLVRILRMYGDERHAPRIAARIVSARSRSWSSPPSPPQRGAAEGTRRGGRSRRCASRSTMSSRRSRRDSPPRYAGRIREGASASSRTTRSRTASSPMSSRR